VRCVAEVVAADAFLATNWVHSARMELPHCQTAQPISFRCFPRLELCLFFFLRNISRRKLWRTSIFRVSGLASGSFQDDELRETGGGSALLKLIAWIREEPVLGLFYVLTEHKVYP